MKRGLSLILLTLVSSCNNDEREKTKHLFLPYSSCIEGAAIIGGDKPGSPTKYVDPKEKWVHRFDVKFKDDNYIPIATPTGENAIMNILVIIDYAEADQFSPSATWPPFARLFDDGTEDGLLRMPTCVQLPHSTIINQTINTCDRDIYKSGNIIYASSEVQSDDRYLVITEKIQPNVYLYGTYRMQIAHLDEERAREIMKAIKQAVNLRKVCDDH